MKKVISIFLALVIAVSSAGVCAYAQADSCSCGEDPIVFVEGIGNATIYKDVTAQEPETIFSQASDVLSYVTPVNVAKLLFALIFRNQQAMMDVIADVGTAILGGTGCDADGNFPENSGVIFEYPEVTQHGRSRMFKFRYDWRRSPIELAAELDKFIDYIREETGHSKVNLIGFSLGSAITLAYLSEYGHSKISGVVIYSGALNGVRCCGEPFCMRMSYDGPEGLVNYIDGMARNDALTTLLVVLAKLGVVDWLGSFVADLCNERGSEAYPLLHGTFVTSPALWALVPVEYHMEARKAFFAGVEDEYAGLIADIDAYYQIQLRAEEIIDGIIEDGVRFGIISKYGYYTFPLIESNTVMADCVVDTEYSSFGATCAPVGGELTKEQAEITAECGHNHVSPDSMINAATCAYPEYTWFIKNNLHSDNCDETDEIIFLIFYSDEQPTVWTNEKYPQFSLYVEDDDTIVPLTKENAPAFESAIPETFFDRVIDSVKSVF
ncbi:MAG: alpha/beta fold hydrolase [Clostridia bacterium]|nr:alpha/beta fold hydrolase [Clostridia bacterium]